MLVFVLHSFDPLGDARLWTSRNEQSAKLFCEQVNIIQYHLLSSKNHVDEVTITHSPLYDLAFATPTSCAVQ